jgi:uncharacterized zinc-type alcohol dehydrogenase-like protein
MGVKAYAVKTAKGKLEPFEYEPGPLKPTEVEVKVSHCGICHSDIAMIDNDWGFSRYPVVPGHEVIGTVAAVGSAVDGIAVGTRVGVGWWCSSCQKCEWCGRGKENLCTRNPGMTIVGHHGGFAETVRCHWKFAVPMPDGLASEFAGPLMCAGTTVFTPLMQYNVNSTMRTAVLGVGGLGHLAVQFLAKMGCEVTGISSTHDKDEDVRKLGATKFLATRGGNELKKAAGSFDFILSTVSADVPWGDYVNALRPQGRLVIVGIPESDIKFPAFPLLAEKSVSGACAGSPSDIAQMLAFAARHGVKPMTEQFALSDVNAAVERVRSGKVRFRAVLAV